MSASSVKTDIIKNQPKAGTKADLINQIKVIDPSLRGLTGKRKDDLIRLLANLQGNPDTDLKKLARENEELREKLHQSRRSEETDRGIIARQSRVVSGLRLQNQRLVRQANSGSMRTPASTTKVKEQLQSIVELIDDLGKNDHLNSQASKLLNEELLKTYNLLTNSHWSDPTDEQIVLPPIPPLSYYLDRIIARQNSTLSAEDNPFEDIA